MEITGKIKWIDEVKTYGSNGFRKREIVITTQEQYPQNIIIEFVKLSSIFSQDPSVEPSSIIHTQSGPS